jgi:muconate cycloisomerase
MKAVHLERRQLIRSGLGLGLAAALGPAAAANALAGDRSRTIVKAEAYAVPMPLVKPFRQAKGTVTHSDNVYVKLTDHDGRTGWGEGYNVPFLYGRGYQEIFRALTDFLLPILEGRSPVEFIGLSDRLDKALPANRDAKCAVDMALLDLLGHQLQLPVHTLLGGKVRNDVPTIGALPLDTPDAVASKAGQLVGQGFRHLKLKLGTPADWQSDVDRALAARDKVGSKISLVADANGIYNRRVALQVIKGVREARLDHFEQPVNGNDIESMAWLSAKSDTPIAADESLQTLGDAYEISRANAASAMVLKLIKHGGLYRSRQIAHFCRTRGLPVAVSGGTELSIGRAAMVHLHATIPNAAGAVELVDVISGDIAENPLALAPTLPVSDQPGLGITIDENKLEQASVKVHGA